MAERRIRVCLSTQQLELWDGDRIAARYPVSTARLGGGEAHGSEQTPRGLHAVCEKIGAGCATGTVFVGRVPTGETATPDLLRREPDRDWIVTRILRLEGREPGRNRGDGVDSRERFIYIHGTPDEGRIGEPVSHGCIRMKSDEVIELFDRVEVGTPVEIVE